MCEICGKPVDRSKHYVCVVWSPETEIEGVGIVPYGSEELIIFHNSCAPGRDNFRARIAYR